MNEAILLNGLLGFLYDEGSVIRDVNCTNEGVLRIACASSNNILYRTSILCKDGGMVLGSDRSSITSCLELYKSYLKKVRGCMLVVKEGVDQDTGKVVYIKVKATNCNIDVLLMELVREFDKYTKLLGVSRERVNTFVYDTYDRSIDMYPLKSDIEGSYDEVKLSVKKDNIDCSEFYEKIPQLRGIFDEGLLKCMNYFLGNYDISVDVVKNGDIYIPVMYFLYLENIINSTGIC